MLSVANYGHAGVIEAHIFDVVNRLKEIVVIVRGQALFDFLLDCFSVVIDEAEARGKLKRVFQIG